MDAEQLASFERSFRPAITALLPAHYVVSKYSQGRVDFLKKLQEVTPEPVAMPGGLARTLWGITFRSPIFNAAGMFKNGECYDVVAAQGAGAYLAGTTTINPRPGNEKEGIKLPFAPYPRSGAASNWLGLPNEGDEVVASRLSKIVRVDGCPVGVSVMGSPDLESDERTPRLVVGMHLYKQANVDFIEMNESCPNTAHGTPQQNDLERRLKYVAKEFLERRDRTLPVIVKFSNDTESGQIPGLLDMLFKYGYDGVNLGNTSTQYAKHLSHIAWGERRLYNYFTSTFGGGVSGRPLKVSSLTLAIQAVDYVAKVSPAQEFHVIRTGGIENARDLEQSKRARIPLNQWFTGYFENFAQNGHGVYKKLYEGLL
ncbi:MAG TPA: hypothetical protein VLJ21_00300 [Candidatus Binatia bacterium]|nr:hypothetical protein [Candidatus Binatia bacterium]